MALQARSGGGVTVETAAKLCKGRRRKGKLKEEGHGLGLRSFYRGLGLIRHIGSGAPRKTTNPPHIWVGYEGCRTIRTFRPGVVVRSGGIFLLKRCPGCPLRPIRGSRVGLEHFFTACVILLCDCMC